MHLRLLRNEALRSILAPLTGGRVSTHIRPTVAALYLTSSCNSRCIMCDFWKNEPDPKELSSEQWGVIFSRLKAFGVGFIGVNASGEMFTRPDAFEILEHLKRLDLPFGVNTNGLLLTQKPAVKLGALKPRQVTIGLDGVGDDSYQISRGLKRGFSVVSNNIDLLQRAGVANITIGSVMMRENLDDWVKLTEFALKKGLAGVRFTAYHDNYFNPESNSSESIYRDPEFRQQVEATVEKLIQIKRKTGIIRNSEAYLRLVSAFYQDQKSFFPVPCLQGSNRIEMDVYGNVTLCSFVTEPLGNLLHHEMEEIWKSNIHKQARRNAYHGNCPHCFLSCYAEENLRLSTSGFIPTFVDSLNRGVRMLTSRR